eukprot:TRINITY_DN9694_c4_g1_i1.p1 TRINITY_DN9694_c4_g1~~TRINITY_DN9694_c4_g1_i1.p1  ORF type:complete len:120 (+),score=15.53 TRINITY_DN9694_c4_g1_i1:164-523(+)
MKTCKDGTSQRENATCLLNRAANATTQTSLSTSLLSTHPPFSQITLSSLPNLLSTLPFFPLTLTAHLPLLLCLSSSPFLSPSPFPSPSLSLPLPAAKGGPRKFNLGALYVKEISGKGLM